MTFLMNLNRLGHPVLFLGIIAMDWSSLVALNVEVFPLQNNNLESKVRQSVRLAEELLDEVNNLNKEMETVREDKERL